MIFLFKADFKAVCDDRTLDVIYQSDEENLARAERYATEEISSYLRGRYDINSAFAQQEDNRNAQLVMLCCDIALYHLIAWLPMKIGYEIRKERYDRAIAYLKEVQKGNAIPSLPTLTDSTTGDDIGTPVIYGGISKSKYDY